MEAVTLDDYAERKELAKVDFVKTGLKRVHQYENYRKNRPALLKLKELNYDVEVIGMRHSELHVLAKARKPRHSKVDAAASS